MKKLALVLSFVALSAHAEVIINGGFGTDGATGESIPFAKSAKFAAEVYTKLNVKADADNKKTIAIADESFFQCEKPYNGVSRLNAGCQFLLRASQKGKLTKGDLVFTGKLADEIFKALPMPQDMRPGATTKTAGNVSCTKVVVPGAQASCIITGVNAIKMDIQI